MTSWRKWNDWVPEICPHCGEIRALTVGEVNLDPAIPDYVKALIIPILKDQREMQRKVAGAVILTYLREKQSRDDKP